MKSYELSFHPYDEQFLEENLIECNNWFDDEDVLNQQFKLSKVEMDSFPIEDIEVVKHSQYPTGQSIIQAFQNSYCQEPISSEIQIPSSHPHQPITNNPQQNNIKMVTFETHTLIKRAKAEKGDRFETKNLCKHLHTQTLKFLRYKAAVHHLSEGEKDQIKAFSQSNISIELFKDLFKNAKFSAMCKEFYESKYFLRQIMSSKMEMKSKITVIKYLQRMRSLTYDRDIKSWKKDSKDTL